MRTSWINRWCFISSLLLSVLISILSLECSKRLVSCLTLHSHGWVCFGNIYLGSLRLLSSFTLASYHVVTTFIMISTFALNSYSPLFTLMFISSYAYSVGHFVYFTLLLNPFRVSSFHCSFYNLSVHFIICQWTWPFSVFHTLT